MAVCASRVRCRLTGALLGMALVASVSGVRAQMTRDPTIPPTGASSAPAAPVAARSPLLANTALAVIVREGRPYLVVGTRLYAQGQMIEDTRIERISETEVWLREGKTLHRKSLFAGIERRAAGMAPAGSRCPSPGANQASNRVSQAEICPP